MAKAKTVSQSSKKDVTAALMIGLKLLLICAIVAGVVSLVFHVTLEKYEANLQKTKDEAVADIFGVEGLTSRALPAEGIKETVYEVCGADGALIGYCVEVDGKGFGGSIGLMVGYNAACEIVGVRVVAHSETPGLGAKIKDASFLEQYEGKADEITLGEDVDAIGGATVSSRAVTEAVNRASASLQAVLSQNGGAIR